MSTQVTSKILLLNLHDTLLVSKTLHYTHYDGRPFYRNNKTGSVTLFEEELIDCKVAGAGGKKEFCYDLRDCNKLLILLYSFLHNNLKNKVEFEIQGYLMVSCETKQKGITNLRLATPQSELYLTPFEVRCAEHCIKNVLTSLARE